MHLALVLVMQTSDRDRWSELDSPTLLSLAFWPSVTPPLVRDPSLKQPSSSTGISHKNATFTPDKCQSLTVWSAAIRCRIGRELWHFTSWGFTAQKWFCRQNTCKPLSSQKSENPQTHLQIGVSLHSSRRPWHIKIKEADNSHSSREGLAIILGVDHSPVSAISLNKVPRNLHTRFSFLQPGQCSELNSLTEGPRSQIKTISFKFYLTNIKLRFKKEKKNHHVILKVGQDLSRSLHPAIVTLKLWLRLVFPYVLFSKFLFCNTHSFISGCWFRRCFCTTAPQPGSGCCYKPPLQTSYRNQVLCLAGGSILPLRCWTRNLKGFLHIFSFNTVTMGPKILKESMSSKCNAWSPKHMVNFFPAMQRRTGLEHSSGLNVSLLGGPYTPGLQYHWSTHFFSPKKRTISSFFYTGIQIRFQ